MMDQRRSMKAGAFTPATPAMTRQTHDLNEDLPSMKAGAFTPQPTRPASTPPRRT